MKCCTHHGLVLLIGFSAVQVRKKKIGIVEIKQNLDVSEWLIVNENLRKKAAKCELSGVRSVKAQQKHIQIVRGPIPY
jgi:hypothetical protein